MPGNNTSQDEIDAWWDKYCGAVMFVPEAKAKLRIMLEEARNDGGIKALSHVLVYGATGRKRIGQSRSYIVSYLAEQQQVRRDIWESKGTNNNLEEDV